MRPITIALLCLALGACGGDAPKPAKRLEAPQEAVSRVGDVTVRANLVFTDSLNDAVAKQYGIERASGSLMLLVSVRKGPDGQDIALPATITASISNLHGQRTAIAMREMRTGDTGAQHGQAYIDYIGTIRISPPDTLTFDLTIAREGAAEIDMTFSRDFATRD